MPGGVAKSTLSGARELEQVLKRLPERVQRNVMRRATTKAAKVVEKEMRLRAPVGPTGNLKASIGQFGVRGLPKDRLTRSVGALRGGKFKGYHAHLIEFGTIKMPARPFLRPAFDATKGKALKVLADELGKGVERAALRLAGSFRKSGLRAPRRRKRR